METKHDDIYLYGAGGHSKVVLEIIEANGKSVKGFIDDNLKAIEFQGIAVNEYRKDMSPIIISIGNNFIRKSIVSRIEKERRPVFETVVHPSCIISKRVKVEEGTVIMQGAIIQNGSEIGKHCIINTASSIDHDCIVSDFVHISPHATLCGGVTIGEGSWIGADAVVLQGVRIGKWCTIGAGSVVVKDVPDGVTAYGNPCRIH